MSVSTGMVEDIEWNVDSVYNLDTVMLISRDYYEIMEILSAQGE